MNETENCTRGSPSYKSLVSPQPAFYMTDFARSTSWLLSPTWIDFRKSKALKGQLKHFTKHYFVFSACGICPHFISGICPTAVLYLCRGRLCRPPAPPQTFALKCGKNGAKQMSKHSTRSQGGFSPLA